MVLFGLLQIKKKYNTNYDIQLLEEITYVDSHEKLKMLTTDYNEYIQTIESQYINILYKTDMINLGFTSISKGFMIEGDIEDLKEIKFYCNNEIRYEYDQIDLELYAEKIHKDLLYIPFNNNYSYTDKSTESFIGSINLDIFNSMRLVLLFDTFKKSINIGIHSLSLNLMKMHSLEREYFDIKYNESFINCKKINLEKNNECPISYDKFTANCSYTYCKQCKYNFLAEHAKNLNKCPMCKFDWYKPKIYINK
jgi:hypothetical protein